MIATTRAMKVTTRTRIILPLLCVSLVLLNSCGTRDYALPPKETAVIREEKVTPPKSLPYVSVDASSLESKAVSKDKEGYIWGGLRWIGVPESMIAKFKCKLADDATVNEFKALGTAMVGGAVIGVVAKYSGSWFFGKPAASDAGHWFWRSLDETTKNVSQGALRGVMMGGVCETALAGGNFTSFAGFLGQSFAALSTAATLAILSSIAAAPFIGNKMGEPPPVSNRVVGTFEDEAKVGRLSAKWRDLKEWNAKSPIMRGIRYRVAPGLVIIGVGAGVGLLVYEGMQSGEKNVGVDCGG